MLFSSTIFITQFLPLLLFCYFLIPKKWIPARNLVLLVFSVVFYSFGGIRCTLLLLLSAMVNYAAGMLMTYPLPFSTRRLPRKAVCILAVCINLCLLGWFKYAAFGASILRGLGIGVSIPEVVLPLGISFYTFQGMSYLLDVYRGTCPVQKNPLLLLLYIVLFPQLVAGPIVNYGDVADALACRSHTLEDMANGITRFCFGFGKKMLLAGPMGKIADSMWALEPSALTCPAAWVGAAAYFFQIYFDFSAYSDMAIGLGQMFGFSFPENFCYPYVAASVTEFWRRWHITLSRWFREYVYIPLGGNRCSPAKHIRNLAIVWLLTGLWHGADWTFLLWGAYYGVLLIAEKQIPSSVQQKIPRILRWAATMGIVCIGWVLFRAPSLSAAGVYLSALFGGGHATQNSYVVFYLRQYLPEWFFCVLLSFPVYPWLHERYRNRPVWLAAERALSLGIFALSYICLVTGSFNPFIYFHF